jgi:serine/threonine protein kinase
MFNLRDSKERTNISNIEENKSSDVAKNTQKKSPIISEDKYDCYYNGLETINDQKDDNFRYDDYKNYYRIFINDHIINRYQILKLLGKGAFGNVILGFDHKNNNLNAIKIIRNEKRFKKQVINEISILNTLDNPNIISFDKEFMFKNHVCLVFEYFGSDLYNNYIKKKFEFSRQDIKSISRQILLGLDYIHKKNIIHCDLKPENILINNDKKIKLIDFGSSVKMDHSFQSNYFYIQSRWYRSPDVILELNFNTKIDIWSFGCILYELIALKPLFAGKSSAEQIYLYHDALGEMPEIYLKQTSYFNYFYNNHHIKKSFTKRPNNLSYVLNIFPKEYQLILHSLILDPNTRPNAEELLHNEYFIDME